MSFWHAVLNPVPIMQNLIASVIWILFAMLVAFRAYRYGKKVHPVRIHVRKVTGPELTRTRPLILIATVSPYQRRTAEHLTDAEFAAALSAGDLDKLPLSPTTPSIGQIVLVLDTYRGSLNEIFLITTMSEGLSSLDSVPLLRNHALRSNPNLVVHAGPEYSVSLNEDNQVAESAHRVATRIFERLRKEKRYVPDESRILVDVTGGPRSMQIGVLLACLRPEQDVHVVGMKYDKSTGDPDYASAFPMVIHFEPDLRISR